jgi:hypothetical protein
MMCHAWDLSDFQEKCEQAKEHPRYLVELATAAQDEYRNALYREGAKTKFCNRVFSIITKSISSD